MPRRKQPPRGPQLELAGALCVAFVNTAGARDRNRQQRAESYADLLAWGRQANVLSASQAEQLSRRAAERPGEAKAAFTRIAKLRSSLCRIFRAIASEKELPDADLALVNEALAEAMPAVRLVRGEGGVTVGWAGDEDALDRMIWPVLFSVMELLTSLEGRPHVRQCAAPECDLFFVPSSTTALRQPRNVASNGGDRDSDSRRWTARR